MDKIKVMHYINSLDQGGAETLVKNYALLLDKQKIDLVVLVHDKKDTLYERELKAAGIRVRYATGFIPFVHPCKHYLLRRLIYKSGITKYIVRHIIRLEKPDILHTHLRCNEIIKFAVAGSNFKIFHTVHSAPSAYWDDKSLIAKQDFESCAYLVKNHNMRLIALHEGMRQELNKLFGVENTLVFNNGIIFDKFKVDESKEEIRRALNISEKSFVVGHIGRFVPVKNHELIIESFKKLSEIREDAHLLLVGEGPLRSSIEKKIAELNIQDKVTILNPRGDIPRIFKAMDVFLLPSLWEGLGIVLVEAQAMGIYSIVSSNVPPYAFYSNLVMQMPAGANASAWAEAINSVRHVIPEYKDVESWDIRKIVKEIEKLYECAVVERKST